MASPVANPDQQPPTAPTNLVATASANSVNLTWTAATDNVGVAPLQRAPRDDVGLHADNG